MWDDSLSSIIWDLRLVVQDGRKWSKVVRGMFVAPGEREDNSNPQAQNGRQTGLNSDRKNRSMDRFQMLVNYWKNDHRLKHQKIA